MPAMHPIVPVRVWVQKVLPLVYDDSLSYYELLNKVVAKVNEVINYVDNDIESVIKEVVDQYLFDITYDEENQRIKFRFGE